MVPARLYFCNLYSLGTPAYDFQSTEEYGNGPARCGATLSTPWLGRCSRAGRSRASRGQPACCGRQPAAGCSPADGTCREHALGTAALQLGAARKDISKTNWINPDSNMISFLGSRPAGHRGKAVPCEASQSRSRPRSQRGPPRGRGARSPTWLPCPRAAWAAGKGRAGKGIAHWARAPCSGC